jgi:hypothetical protein
VLDCVPVLLWLPVAEPVELEELGEVDDCAAEASPDCGSVLLCPDVLDCEVTSEGGCAVEEVAELEVGGREEELDEAAPLCGSDDVLEAPVDGGFSVELPTFRLLTMVAPGAAERAISSARCLSCSVETVPFSVI